MVVAILLTKHAASVEVEVIPFCETFLFYASSIDANCKVNDGNGYLKSKIVNQTIFIAKIDYLGIFIVGNDFCQIKEIGRKEIET